MTDIHSVCYLVMGVLFLFGTLVGTFVGRWASNCDVFAKKPAGKHLKKAKIIDFSEYKRPTFPRKSGKTDDLSNTLWNMQLQSYNNKMLEILVMNMHPRYMGVAGVTDIDVEGIELPKLVDNSEEWGTPKEELINWVGGHTDYIQSEFDRLHFDRLGVKNPKVTRFRFGKDPVTGKRISFDIEIRTVYEGNEST